MKEPVESVDDMSCPPYVTMSGDLFCSRCGQRYDEAEEEEAEDWKYDGYYEGAEEKNAKSVVPGESSEEEKREKEKGGV